jgi:predicted GNAT family N-acyltransferase
MITQDSDSKAAFRIADWAEEKEQLSSVRRQVFIIEQHVPEELEWDGFDETATHIVASIDGKIIGTARLKTDGQIGRMAVLKPYRNNGIGSRLLQLVLTIAQEEQYPKVYLHAQVEAIPFYEKHGFTTEGDVFYEANIPHRGMFKILC